MLKYIFTTIFTVAFLSLNASPNIPKTDEERAKAFEALVWEEHGVHELNLSNSKIDLPKGYFMLLGEHAKMERLINGDSSTNETIDAVIYSKDKKNNVVLEYFPEGYIKLDDWDKVDSDAMLTEISEGTEEYNKERAKLGLEPFHVVGWIKPPHLNKNTNTVYWSLEAKDDEHSFVNSIALRLSRNGYEKFTLITDKETFTSGPNVLQKILKVHNFDSGYRYEDHIPGDKIAEYGIAALVAASVGAKIAKATGLLLLLKKFAALIVAAVAGIFYKIKNYFGSKKATA
jgi:uncharacterized membrane-anchored protein